MAWLSPQIPQIRLVMKWASRGSLALHENAVAAEDGGSAVTLGHLAIFKIDLGVNAQAADDPGDRDPNSSQPGGVANSGWKQRGL